MLVDHTAEACSTSLTSLLIDQYIYAPESSFMHYIVNATSTNGEHIYQHFTYRIMKHCNVCHIKMSNKGQLEIGLSFLCWPLIEERHVAEEVVMLVIATS